MPNGSKHCTFTQRLEKNIFYIFMVIYITKTSIHESFWLITISNTCQYLFTPCVNFSFHLTDRILFAHFTKKNIKHFTFFFDWIAYVFEHAPSTPIHGFLRNFYHVFISSTAWRFSQLRASHDEYFLEYCCIRMAATRIGTRWTY